MEQYPIQSLDNPSISPPTQVSWDVLATLFGIYLADHRLTCRCHPLHISVSSQSNLEQMTTLWWPLSRSWTWTQQTFHLKLFLTSGAKVVVRRRSYISKAKLYLSTRIYEVFYCIFDSNDMLGYSGLMLSALTKRIMRNAFNKSPSCKVSTLKRPELLDLLARTMFTLASASKLSRCLLRHGLMLKKAHVRVQAPLPLPTASIPTV